MGPPPRPGELGGEDRRQVPAVRGARKTGSASGQQPSPSSRLHFHPAALHRGPGRSPSSSRWRNEPAFGRHFQRFVSGQSVSCRSSSATGEATRRVVAWLEFAGNGPRRPRHALSLRRRGARCGRIDKEERRQRLRRLARRPHSPRRAGRALQRRLHRNPTATISSKSIHAPARRARHIRQLRSAADRGASQGPARQRPMPSRTLPTRWHR